MEALLLPYAAFPQPPATRQQGSRDAQPWGAERRPSEHPPRQAPSAAARGARSQRRQSREGPVCGPRRAGPAAAPHAGPRPLPASGPAGSCRGRSRGPEVGAGGPGTRGDGDGRGDGGGADLTGPRRREGGEGATAAIPPRSAAPALRGLRLARAAGSGTRARPPCSSQGEGQARPGRHLLPARTGPSPALPPTTGRVSLCRRRRRRRHFPAAASLPPTVRFLHSPGPGTASSPSLPPALPALRKRSTSPTPPTHTNGGRPTPATQARSENSTLRSSHAPHPDAMKGAR